MNPIIAEAWLPNGVSKAIRTAPGRFLPFVGGKATVRQESDMPFVLAMPDAHVQVSNDWQEWLPKWVDKMPGYDDKVKARVDILPAPETEDEPMAFIPYAPPVAPQSATVAVIPEGMDKVVFGKHKVGCKCGYCQKKRQRVLAKMQAEPVLA